MSTNSNETPRLELQGILASLCQHVYFEPPPNIRLQYPAIKYERRDINPRFADDSNYNRDHAYTITVISSDPDEPIVELIAKLPMASYDRHYNSDGLSHDVFTLYYK